MRGDRSRESDDTVEAPTRPGAAFDATVRIDASLDATIRSPLADGEVESALPIVAPGRYRMEEEVGRGGIGRVVSAHDTTLERTVAIKELAEDSGEARRRFEREILITARLQHPSIVPIYDAGRWPDQAAFYAMKLVTGRPLSDAIDAATTLDARLGLLPNVLAVADAVAYAHGERVVHRDLKPHNVLVGDHGETVVIDWGIAKELGPRDGRDAGGRPRTVPGVILGTPAYMAPEQASGEAVDERADVYALGAMLYQVVSGVSPHVGRTLPELLARIGGGQIPSLAEREPRAPAELGAIVAKAMARVPDDRYPTARELADDLRRYTTDQLVGAHRYTPLERVHRFVRRKAAVVIVAMLLAASGVWSGWSLQREKATAVEAARLELELAVSGIQRDVSFALDQADPMLVSLRSVADPALPLADVAPRLHDLVIGRPGVANASIGFPSGLFRGTFIAEGGAEIDVQESVVGDGRTTRHNYRIIRGALTPAGEIATDYDVRRRPHYQLAARGGKRAWTPPRTYFTSRSTGITCTEPIYGDDGSLRAVTTVDFDVGALSAYLTHPPIDGARAVLFAADGSVLAFPGAKVPDVAMKEGRLLRHEDFGDPALDAVLAEVGARPPAALRFVEIRAGGEDYLVAVAPMGGRRAGVTSTLDGYVATIAPTKVLLGPSAARQRPARLVLAAALLLATVAAIGSFVARARRRT